MKSPKDLLRIEAAYLQPTGETGDREAFAEVRRVTDPAFADAREFAERWQMIATNRNLSPSGRKTELAKLEMERQNSGARHMAHVGTALQETALRIQRLTEAMDRGMEPHGTGWVLKNHVSDDPRQIALDGEARGYWRTLDRSEFRETYRQWVVADDQRARVAEQDPAGDLVSQRDRDWARQWRIDHSPLLPKLKVLQAQQRTYALVLETVRMEFGLTQSNLGAPAN